MSCIDQSMGGFGSTILAAMMESSRKCNERHRPGKHCVIEVEQRQRTLPITNHADDRIAPVARQPLRADDADLGHQRQPDRQLERDAERQHQLHHQVEILADAKLRLDRNAAASRGAFEAEEERPCRRKHHVVGERSRRAGTAPGSPPGTAGWRASRCDTGRGATNLSQSCVAITGKAMNSAPNIAPPSGR